MLRAMEKRDRHGHCDGYDESSPSIPMSLDHIQHQSHRIRGAIRCFLDAATDPRNSAEFLGLQFMVEAERQTEKKSRKYFLRLPQTKSRKDLSPSLNRLFRVMIESHFLRRRSNIFTKIGCFIVNGSFRRSKNSCNRVLL